MSTQKLRRNFRNSKNSKEHKQMQREDELQQKEAKLEKLKLEFNLCLQQLNEFEEANIFSRDDNNTIADALIETNLLSTILSEYETLINQQKQHYINIQNELCSICGEMNANTMNLNTITTELDTFYDGFEAHFEKEDQFRTKLTENLNKMYTSNCLISPLIYGKHVESPLKVAIELSSIYSSIKLEKKQYSLIKKELKKYEHETLTMPMTPKRLPQCASLSSRSAKSTLYEIRDLTEIEKEIAELRKQKSETMKALIARAYGKNNLYLKELKLRQAALHYADSIADDQMMSLKLQRELLEIQCEEIENELIGLEIRKEINSSKQKQLTNVLSTYLSEALIHSKDIIANKGRSELSRLTKVDREQKRLIELTEQEIAENNQLIYNEKEKQKKLKQRKTKQEESRNNKLLREKSYNVEIEEEEDNENKEVIEALRNEYETIKKERMSLEQQLQHENETYNTKTKHVEDLTNGITQCLQTNSELQREIHQYENHIHSNQYLSQNTSRKNSSALEFIAEMQFMNKEYEIKMDQINNKYREQQTLLKNKFVTDYNNTIKKKTAHRQSEIEQESYNIIMKRKDKELAHLTQTMTASAMDKEVANTFNNKTKPVKIRFGKNKLVSMTHIADTADATTTDILLKDGLQPIKFEWNAFDDAKESEIDNEDNVQHVDGSNDDDEDDKDADSELEHKSNEENNNESYIGLNYDELIREMNQNNVNVYDLLNHQIDENNDNKDTNDINKIQSEYLQFDDIDMMGELLVNWTTSSMTPQHIPS